ncbi:MAG: hypothetical protein KDB53_01375, partial [Planctomycetes bacterium]|nr:hypothetical protein [Planctomycetota bacterium]
QGVPTLTVSGPPILGTTITLDLGNSRGLPTTVCLLIGTASQTLATTIGGTVLVDPSFDPVLSIPAGVSSFPVAIPCSLDLCGLSFYLQALEWDLGASQSYSFSQGLELRYGE